MLTCTVSILKEFEPIDDPHDWIIGTHGIRIQFALEGKNHSMTYLPEVAVERGWNQHETVSELLKKHGFNVGIETINDVKVERYKTDDYKSNYQEYNEYINSHKDAYKLTGKIGSVKEVKKA